LIGERHDSDVSHLRGFDDAAFDEPSEVDHQGRTFYGAANLCECLSWLQGDDATTGKRCLVDVSGTVIDVVGNEDRACVLGIADGMGSFPLPSFDRVEEYGHSA
jgi:hypothetical protein